VSNKKVDIAQIRKYHNGELNAAAMHKLEREALDDPFLMDALEGYEAAGKDQQANLNELSERLEQRISVKKGRIIPWKAWSIAASIIVVLTIGGLWLKKTPPAQKVANIALSAPDKTKVEPSKDTLKTPAAPVAQAPLIIQNAKQATVVKPAGKLTDKALYQQEISAADANVPAAPNSATTAYAPPVVLREVKPQEEKKDNTQQLSEVVVMNYNQQSKQDSLEKAELARSKAKYSAATVDSKLQGKVEGLTVITSKDSKTQFGPGHIAGTNISGIIISKDDGQPVIGAAIRIKGTNKSTVTNTNGYFALPVSGDKETLDIASIGYERKQVSAKGGDSLKVELDQVKGALSEVAVVGYGAKKDADGEPAAESAHPQDGWSSLKKYLQTNAFLVDGTTGSVSIAFTVDTNGTLSDFKIKKSLNATADQKAIDLIKAGPSWVGNNNRKPEQVTVKVKFQKQK
jgi:outer membrane biosynthesis protein TonB